MSNSWGDKFSNLQNTDMTATVKDEYWFIGHGEGLLEFMPRSLLYDLIFKSWDFFPSLYGVNLIRS